MASSSSAYSFSSDRAMMGMALAATTSMTFSQAVSSSTMPRMAMSTPKPTATAIQVRWRTMNLPHLVNCRMSA